jgi:hypothetical protein
LASHGFFQVTHEQNKAAGVGRIMKGDLEKRTQQAIVAITLSTATLVACASLLLFR